MHRRQRPLQHMAVTPESRAITPIPCHACTAMAEKLNTQPQLPNKILACPQFLLGGISLQFPDCLQNEGKCSKQHVERIDKLTARVPYIPH